MWLVTTTLDSDVGSTRAQKWLLDVHAPVPFLNIWSAGSFLGLIDPYLIYKFEHSFFPYVSPA